MPIGMQNASSLCPEISLVMQHTEAGDGQTRTLKALKE